MTKLCIKLFKCTENVVQVNASSCYYKPVQTHIPSLSINKNTKRLWTMAQSIATVTPLQATQQSNTHYKQRTHALGLQQHNNLPLMPMLTSQSFGFCINQQGFGDHQHHERVAPQWQNNGAARVAKGEAGNTL